MKDELADSGNGDAVAMSQSLRTPCVQLAAVEFGLVSAAQIRDVAGVSVKRNLRVQLTDVPVVDADIHTPATERHHSAGHVDPISGIRTVFLG